MKLKLIHTTPQETCETLAFEIGKLAFNAFCPDEYQAVYADKNDFRFLRQSGYCNQLKNFAFYYEVEPPKHKEPNCQRMQLTMFSATRSSKTLALMALLTKFNDEGSTHVMFQLDVIEGEPNLEFSMFYQNTTESFAKLKAILERLRTMELTNLDIEF